MIKGDTVKAYVDGKAKFGKVSLIRPSDEYDSVMIPSLTGTTIECVGPTHEIATVRFMDGTIGEYRSSDLSLVQPTHLRVAS